MYQAPNADTDLFHLLASYCIMRPPTPWNSSTVISVLVFLQLTNNIEMHFSDGRSSTRVPNKSLRIRNYIYIRTSTIHKQASHDHKSCRTLIILGIHIHPLVLNQWAHTFQWHMDVRTVKILMTTLFSVMHIHTIAPNNVPT